MTQELSREQQAEFLVAFALADSNGDGHITNDELATAMRFLGHNPSQDDVNGLVGSVPVQNAGVLAFPEFLAVMERQL